MKNKILIKATLSFFMIMSSFSFVKAADEYITVGQTYTSSSETETYTFDDVLQMDGHEYSLVSTETTKVTKREQTITKEFADLQTQVVDSDLVENNVQYSLKDVQYKEKEIQEGTVSIDHVENLGFSFSQPQAENTFSVTYEMNGTTKSAELPLAELMESSSYWKDGFSFTGNYSGDKDVLYYNFNGTQIPNTSENEVPYNSFEEPILQSMGLTTANTRILGASWVTQADNNRVAQFDCSRLGQDYKARYALDVPNLVTVYDAEATYTLTDVNESYEITAQAVYKIKENKLLKIIKFVGLILIVAAIIVAILFIITKRKKKKEKK